MFFSIKASQPELHACNSIDNGYICYVFQVIHNLVKLIMHRIMMIARSFEQIIRPTLDYGIFTEKARQCHYEPFHLRTWHRCGQIYKLQSSPDWSDNSRA